MDAVAFRLLADLYKLSPAALIALPTAQPQSTLFQEELHAAAADGGSTPSR